MFFYISYELKCILWAVILLGLVPMLSALVVELVKSFQQTQSKSLDPDSKEAVVIDTIKQLQSLFRMYPDIYEGIVISLVDNILKIQYEGVLRYKYSDVIAEFDGNLNDIESIEIGKFASHYIDFSEIDHYKGLFEILIKIKNEFQKNPI